MSKPTVAPVVGADLHPASIPAVSVYVHVPFCSSRCNYCDFYFETTRSPRVIALTLERILDEADYFMSAMGRPRVTSLYFGGGTPSIVPPPLLDSFLARLRSILGLAERADDDPAAPGIETTFEANPESTSTELLEVLLDRGINRVSLGVQSFDDDSLRALTRRADRSRVMAVLEMLRGARESHSRLRLNVDLITGIPGQTPEKVRADIDAAAGFGVDHFSLYSLTVEEHTPLRQAVDEGVRTMPPARRQDDLWLAGRRAIVERGFEWYEISNFARPGCRSEHNLRYWRLEPYLGLGPGAVSTLPMARSSPPERAPAPVRLSNPNLFVYASRLDRRWHHAAEELAPASFLFEHFVTGLRTDEGISLARIEREFGVDLATRWEGELSQWAHRGFLEGDRLLAAQPRLVLTQSGRLALDRRLLEIGEWIDGLGGLPEAEWPDRAGAKG